MQAQIIIVLRWHGRSMGLYRLRPTPKGCTECCCFHLHQLCGLASRSLANCQRSGNRRLVLLRRVSLLALNNTQRYVTISCFRYIEQGPITTSVGSGTASPPSSPSSPGTTAAPPITSSPATTIAPSPTTTASGPLQSQWGQCGGTGYTGPTACSGTFKCIAVSPPYYYQVRYS